MILLIAKEVYLYRKCRPTFIDLYKLEWLSPPSEASSEVAHLTERKNTHPPVYGFKEFVCLSVTNFNLNYLRTGEIKTVFLNFETAREKNACTFLSVIQIILRRYIHLFNLTKTFYNLFPHIHKSPDSNMKLPTKIQGLVWSQKFNFFPNTVPWC